MKYIFLTMMLTSNIISWPAYAQFFLPSAEELLSRPMRSVNRPEVPNVSTAAMFFEACINSRSLYYNGRSFVKYLPIERVDGKQSIFDTAFSRLFYNIDESIQRERQTYLIRSEPDEYLDFFRLQALDGSYFEQCSMITQRKGVTALAFDFVQSAQNTEYSVEFVGERNGVVGLELSASTQPQNQSMAIYISPIEVDDTKYTWVMIMEDYP